MQFRRLVSWALFALVFCSCEGINKSYVTKDFYLIDMDYDEEDRSLSFSLGDGDYVGVVGPTVVGYALRGKYILVKQRHKQHTEPKSTREPVYYIVNTNVERLKMPKQGVTGPLALATFDRTCRKLGISTPVHFVEE